MDAKLKPVTIAAADALQSMPMIAKILLSAALLSLAACATMPPPTADLNAADTSINRAVASRLDNEAPTEIRTARNKLAAAQDAVARGEMQQAARLALESKLDADFANARSEASRAQFNVEAMQLSNEALRQESLRSSVNVAPIPLPMPSTDAPANGGN